MYIYYKMVSYFGDFGINGLTLFIHAGYCLLVYIHLFYGYTWTDVHLFSFIQQLFNGKYMYLVEL